MKKHVQNVAHIKLKTCNFQIACNFSQDISDAAAGMFKHVWPFSGHPALKYWFLTMLLSFHAKNVSLLT